MIKNLDSKSLSENASRIWKRFGEISSIPRPSKGEEKVANYLETFARDKGFSVERDSENNVLIRIPATNGHEKSKGVLLQCHSDMVCVADSCAENPRKVGVIPEVDEKNKWITAQHTTLGADNGIGVATFLALLEDKDFLHGPLAVLITTDEETGLNGAKNLEFDLSDYKYLLNGDSEEWGEATIGCAGGEDFIFTQTFQKEAVRSSSEFVNISVSGLSGGHSALAIAEVGRANAIELLGGIMTDVIEHIGIQLIDIKGGTARNVIPSEASAIFSFVPQDNFDINKTLKDIVEKYVKEFTREPHIEIDVLPGNETSEAFSLEDTERVLSLIYDIPHGVHVWADDAETIPQTSTNLATIETTKDSIIITNMSRSSIAEELDEVQKLLELCAKENEATTKREGRYSGWEPIADSYIVKTIKNVYKDLFKDNMHITQTHGGLECGIILSKYPHFEAISFGPTIEGAHSTKEKVEIESVEKFYDLTKALVKSLSV